jgi:hypothetical protein
MLLAMQLVGKVIEVACCHRWGKLGCSWLTLQS